MQVDGNKHKNQSNGRKVRFTILLKTQDDISLSTILEAQSVGVSNTLTPSKVRGSSADRLPPQHKRQVGLVVPLSTGINHNPPTTGKRLCRLRHILATGKNPKQRSIPFIPQASFMREAIHTGSAECPSNKAGEMRQRG